MMKESDLAFHTTSELIAELMRRRTFMGVVVHSDPEWKGEPWGAERTFRVHFNSNLDTGQATRLLDAVARYLDVEYC
jgi:hypothetical protein